MGVHNLDTFIKNLKQAHQNCMDSELLRNRKIVIEGYALCLSLYFEFFASTWYYGGDYHEYYGSVCKFFEQLKNNNIEAYVVMDGIHTNGTMQERNVLQQLDKKNETIAPLPIVPKDIAPLFVVHVFLDALREKGIDFFVSDDKVEREIASLANYFSCPVLGKNSDFYVFKLEGGFIPMTPEYCEKLTDGRPIDIFRYQNFNRQFTLHDDDLMLFLPIFLGNGFHRSPVSMRRLGFGEQPEVREVTSYIQNFRSFDDVARNLERRGYQLSLRCQDAKQFYTIQPASFEELEKCKEQMICKMPSWVFTAYKRGVIQKDLVTFLVRKQWNCRRLVEDMQQKSAWEFTRMIREVIMAILTPQDCTISILPDTEHNNNHITEATNVLPTLSKVFARKVSKDATNDSKTDSREDSSGSEPEIKEIAANQIVESVRACGKTRIENKPIQIIRSPIHNLIDYTLTCKKPESRRRALLVIADCCEIKDQLETIPEGLQLAVIATHYWVKKNRLYRQYLQPLVCCIMTCFNSSKRFQPRLQITSAELRPLAHVFAHWQCTLHDLIALNQVLNQPYRYTSPAHLFSGTILHYFLEKMENTDDSKELHADLAQKLMKIIMHKLGDDS